MSLRAVLEISGTLLVLFTLREVFRDIFHPTRSGNLSDAIGRGDAPEHPDVEAIFHAYAERER